MQSSIISRIAILHSIESSSFHELPLRCKFSLISIKKSSRVERKKNVNFIKSRVGNEENFRFESQFNCSCCMNSMLVEIYASKKKKKYNFGHLLRLIHLDFDPLLKHCKMRFLSVTLSNFSFPLKNYHMRTLLLYLISFPRLASVPAKKLLLLLLSFFFFLPKNKSNACQLHCLLLSHMLE